MRARRSHAELDRLLDRLVSQTPGGQDPEATGDLAPFLHPARVARATLVQRLPEDVRRAHLVALRQDRVRNVVVPAARPRFRVARIAIVAAIVAVLGCGSALAASANALPGDPLYGVKRAAERISLAMHRDPVGRSALHLEFAENRSQEVQELLAAGRSPSEALEALQDELDAAEADALNAQALGRDVDALLAHVQAMFDKHITVLTGVLDQVGSDQAKEAIQRAIDRANDHQANVRGKSGEHKPEEPGKPTGSPGKSGDAPGKP